MFLRTLFLCSFLFDLSAGTSHAVTLRKQVEQRGDFIFIGNTVGWDCGMNDVPPPVVGTVPAAGSCGPATSVQDTSPDVLWRSDQPPGGATASLELSSSEARSTAILDLPPGATVTYARLYWGAMKDGGTAGSSVLVEREGGAVPFSVRATADASYTVLQTPTMQRVYYNSTADITDLVAASGSGPYRVAGIETVSLNGLSEFTAFVSWSMVVFYRRDSEPQRNLALFDGLDLLRPMDRPVTTVTLSGFRVPPTGFDGKLGVLTYEGDLESTGDYLTFNGTLISNAANPPTNFFNGTRSFLGNPVSVAGDLPQLTGTAASHSGIDMDVVDITALLQRDQTQATITATSSGDNYLLAAFITSISSLKPEFSNSAKTVRDLTNPMGPVRPGDTVEYTIVVQNNGNDAATGVVFTDALPPGITYVPGSLRILAGANAGDKTDAPADDQGEYLAPTRTLRVRLGTGADAVTGGTMEIGETTTLVFRATIDMGTAGMTIYNQGTINAGGRTGNPPTDYPTDGGGNGRGTPLPVDECGGDGDCPMARPFCLTTANPNVCVECRDNSNCPMDRPICSASRHVCVPMCATDDDCPMMTPACLPSGVCGQCSATNSRACTGLTPICDVPSARCVECLTNATCPPGRPFCNLMTKRCVGCTTNADCPAATPFCDPMTGACRGCASDADCGGATPLCDVPAGRCVSCLTNANCMAATPVCDPMVRVCRGCRGDGECPMTAPACQPGGSCGECSATNASRCLPPTPVCDPAAARCVECVSNAQCSGTRPVCNLMTRTCRACMADGECPAETPACLATGACAECSATNASRCTGARPLCDVASNRCVGCLTSADCASPTAPFCSPMTRTCVPCEADGPPSCPDPARPACQRAGALAGACTECSATNASRCGGIRPQCLTALGLCGCSDSDGDSECGGPMSGIVCSGPAGTCIPGCSSAPGRNRCPVPLVCSGETPPARPGMCVLPPGCASDAQCPPPRPICDLSVIPRVCVQCLTDAQCMAPLVCDQMGSKLCVECAPGKTAACRAELAGSRCLPANVCGCQVDADCGGPTSGRVCDTAIGRCTIGCRGTGGNRCPAPLICSSLGPEIGRCGTLPPDAGPPDVMPPPDAARDAAPIDAPRDFAPIPPDAPGADRLPVDTTPPRDTAAGDAGPPPDVVVRDAGRDQRTAGGRGFLGGGGCACAVPGGADRGGGGEGGGGLTLAGLAALAAVVAGGRRRRARREGRARR